MVINCKVQTGTCQGRAKGHKKKRDRYCQAIKLFAIVAVFISLSPRAKGADVEDNENAEAEEEFVVGEDGGKVSMNKLPGHGMSAGNDPTYDPYTIGAKHGFGNRGGKKPDIDDSTLARLRNTAENGNKDSLYFLGLFYYYGNGVQRSRSKAVEYFTEAAKLGHAEAKSNLGMIFAEGLGVSRDTEAALAWLNQAIDLGNGDAMWLKGVMYRDGNGVKANHTLSFELFKKSAELKNPKGLYHLGVNFEYGLGTEQNFTRAFKCYQEASSLKDPEAQYFLGLMVAYGRGVNQNFLKALEMFTKAAEVGHVPSQIQVAKMHANGQGVARDYDNAIYWFNLAAESGNSLYAPQASQWRDELKALLSEARANQRLTTQKFSNLRL